MKTRSLTFAFTVLVGLGIATSLAFAQAPARKVFGKGHPFTIEELPAGQLKSKLQSLDPKARGNAMKWLHTFNFADFDAAEHLRADLNGGIYIVCPHAECKKEGDSNKPTASAVIESGAMAGEDTTMELAATTEPPIAPASVPNSSPPAYNSKPGASRHIYLDFNGAIVTGTQWNAERGVTSWDCLPWTYDADATTFSDTEQALIKRTWERIAEDYAPFDVNVTTDVTYDPDNYTGDKNKVGWVLYTPKTDRNGVNCPHIDYAGGVAYIGVFGDTNYYSKYQPAWGRGASTMTQLDDMAEVGSHEMGHNMGLSHDGTPTLTYYAGHNGTSTAPSWGPIMGSGFARDVSQWSKGEYYNADMFQDDLAIISARVPYRVDDHGDSFATATTWTNTTVNQAGIVERTGNADYFKFTTSAGLVSLSASTYRDIALNWGCNVDIQLELYDSAYALVTSNNPAADTKASISTTLAAGTYYLVLKPSAAGTPLATSPSGYTVYGSLGQYTITGSFPSSAEIAVEQPVGTNLTDGVSSINCGSATIPASATPVTFTVKNLGISNLTGLAISKDGTHSADFTLGSLGAATLAPGASTTFTVTFTPGGAGARTAAIHITSNDSDESPFDIALTGTGYTVGTLAVTPAGNLTSSGKYGGPFSPSSLQYTLSNTGNTSIVWTAVKTAAWVGLSATTGTLDPGASTTVTASINSAANSLVLGSYSDTVTFTNTTNGNGNASRGVSLTVTPEPYPVSYNGNGNSGGTAPSSELKPHDVGLVLSGPGTLVRSGFSFAGWNTAANGGGTPYSAGATYTVNAAATLYAQWNALPTVNAGADQLVALSTSIPWTPAQITTAAWYDASDAGTVIRNGTAVTNWNDKSGNGRNLAQTTTANQPVYTATLNGLGVITYDGSNDILKHTGSAVSFSGMQSAFVCMQGTGGGNYSGPVQWSGTDGFNLRRNNASPQLQLEINSGAGNVYSTCAGPSSFSVPYIGGMSWDGSQAIPYANGVGANAASVTGTIDVNTVAAGTTNAFQGQIAEIVHCNSNDSTVRLKLEGYLAHKWGLAGSLPTDHPYKAAAPGSPTAVVNLDGTVSDPNGDSLTTAWTKVSGPGAVTFGNASAVDTTATFAIAGTYTLRFTATDPVASVADDVVITVYDPGSVGPLDHFAISTIASPQTAGVPITGITITAQDAANLPVTSFTGTVTFGGTGGFTGTSSSFTAGVLTGLSVMPTTAGSNLTFTVDDGSSHTGSVTIATIRAPYTVWSGGTAFDADTNGDGVKDGMAWILGAISPSGSMQGKLPLASRSGESLRMTFRCLKSNQRAGVVIKVQSSSDCGISDPWTSHEAAVPDSDLTINGVIFNTTDDGDFINVTADIPATGNKLFGRIMVIE